MKKNLKLSGFSLLISMLLLTSCNLFSIEYQPYSYNDTFTGETNIHAIAPQVTSVSKRFFDVTRSNPSAGFRTLTLDSRGEQKLLVLPISFSDYDINNVDGEMGKRAHIELQNAFFGRSDSTLWESVASYYYKSSYGNLSLTGEVAPWFESQVHTVATIKQAMENGLDKQTVTSDLLREAVGQFKREFPEKVADYDSDNDGYIDAVYLVYAYPFNNTDRDLGARNIFWAYATYDDKNGHEGEGPFAHNYAWSSYFFTKSHQTLLNRKPDSHTFIHEVAHLFGIPDYYNVNLEDPYNPLGGFDMMDYTIGDHSGLSKLLLEWTHPMVLQSPGNVTLRSFTETGDLLLIANNWNGSAMDEYLLLEYYTPTGLNQFDSRLNERYKLPNRAGLKVYHVDARTVYEVKDGYTKYFYSDDYTGETNGLFEMLAHTNSSGRSNQGKKPEFNLYSLLEKSGENTFIDGEKANENTLFHQGDDFGVSVFADFNFHQGGALPFTFEILDATRDSVTISFKENN